MMKELPEKKMNQNSAGATSYSLAFRGYVIALTIFIWSLYTLLLRDTRTRVPTAELYYGSTVVLLAEAIKFSLSVILLARTFHFDVARTKTELWNEFVQKPREILKLSVPSVVYAVQNNLDFVALSNLEPGVYQVTTQLKVVTTAVFMVVMLGRRYSLRRWIAILALFGGVALVQLDAIYASPETKPTAQPTEQNYFVGISAVLVTCVTAGFAGVYFEMVLKDGSTTSFWIRTIQLHVTGIVVAGLVCLLHDGANIVRNGFFYGYNARVVVIAFLLSMGGIYISMVIKYLDNQWKSFASALRIIVISIASVYLFDSVIGLYFILGTITVCGSILLYNSVPE